MTAQVVATFVSAVLASLLTLAGVLLTSRWKLAEENIFKQRKEWREKVRQLIADAMGDLKEEEARRIWAELALRMNPEFDLDKDDRELVQLVRSLVDPASQNDVVRGRIVDLAAHILKHDWTRAKWEAQGWFWTAEPKQTRLGLRHTPFGRLPGEKGDEPRAGASITPPDA